MATMGRFWATAALAALLWSLAALGDPSIPMNYCASLNTGSTNANHSIYQSDGLCHDFCKAKIYKLAIIQGDSCWCANSLPDKKLQVDPGDCNASCPGFPTDVCGGPGLYGYMIVEAGATTQPAPSPSPSDDNQPPPPAVTTPAPTPTIQTVTADGSVMTVTVMPTNTNVVGNVPNQAPITSQSSGLPAGTAVAIAAAVIAIVVAVAIASFCVWRRKKQRREAETMFNRLSPRGSSAGMASTPGMTEAGSTPPFLGRVGSTWESEGSGRRRSTLMPIDPRIDPNHSGIYDRNLNKSHDSINTLRDDQDYSRRVHQPPKVLRVTNPGDD